MTSKKVTNNFYLAKISPWPILLANRIIIRPGLILVANKICYINANSSRKPLVKVYIQADCTSEKLSEWILTDEKSGLNFVHNYKVIRVELPENLPQSEIKSLTPAEATFLRNYHYLIKDFKAIETFNFTTYPYTNIKKSAANIIAHLESSSKAKVVDNEKLLKQQKTKDDGLRNETTKYLNSKNIALSLEVITMTLTTQNR